MRDSFGGLHFKISYTSMTVPYSFAYPDPDRTKKLVPGSVVTVTMDTVICKYSVMHTHMHRERGFHPMANTDQFTSWF